MSRIIGNHPFNYVLTARFKLRLIRGLLLKNASRGSLLDIGCGSGFLLSQLDGKLGQLVGIDMCAEAVWFGRRFTRAEMAVANAERLPFGNSTFDNIISTDTFEHIPDDAGAMQEVKRVLRPQGSFIIYVPSEEGVLSKTKFVHLFHESQANYLVDRRYYSVASLKKLVQDAGFKVDVVYYHNVFIQEFFTQVLKWLASLGGKKYEHQADIDIFINSPSFPLYRWLFLPVINLLVRAEEIICEGVFGGRIPGHRIIMKCRKI